MKTLGSNRCGTGVWLRRVSPFNPLGIIGVLALCLSSPLAAARSYSLDWDVIAGGGGVSTGARYTLVDTMGQPDAGIATHEPWRWEAGFLPGLNLPPAVSVTPALQTVQYSDPVVVTIKADDPDCPSTSLIAATTWNKDGGSFKEGLPAGLTLLTNAPTPGSRTWTLLGAPQLGLGVYVVRFTVTADQAGSGTADFTVMVTQEDARATYNGALFTSTASASSSLAKVTLSATIQDITAVPGDPAYDPSNGSITNAKVSFISITTVNGVLTTTPIGVGVPVGLVNLSDPKTGTATTNWSVNIGPSDSQQFTIGTVVSGWYSRCASTENTVVTVSKPLASDYVTGGGYVVLTNSAGLYAGDRGTKANFGFSVKYNKAGNSLQGNINAITRRSGRVYQVKGNVMSSLSIPVNQPTAAAPATFNGKASIIDITDPLAPLSVDGNATLQAAMTDKGDPGSADMIAITVWNKAGGLWFASHWNGAKTLEQVLAGGNLMVRPGSASRVAASLGLAPTSAEPLFLTIDRLSGQSARDVSCRFALRFPVVPCTDYILERSADLVTWAYLTTVMSFTDTVEYFDEANSAAGGQFYRVRAMAEPVEDPGHFIEPQSLSR